MDIRNIKSEPETCTSVQLLPKVFEYNREQLEQYRVIELLPDWPFDVNNPNCQRILKDFIGNVIEELTEGMESLYKIRDIMNPHGWNMQLVSEKEIREISNHLQNANEEQADALGFYLTLFEFSNIGPEDLLSYKDVLTWEEIFEYGVAMQYKEGNDAENKGYFFGDKDLVTPGFHQLSEDRIQEFKSLIFEVIYHLSTARNLLKSRIWKQTPVMTKELEYQDELVKSFYMYMGFLAFVGFTPQDYYELFYKKQQLNLWRISTHY